ncbi:MAG: pyruvate formate lyase family protein [Eubacteriales bacterium]|nr:pyruvate formate lyase family protein [Eubacteriales bacterium]
MTHIQHAQYIMKFIDTYRENTGKSIAEREAACLSVQFPSSLSPIISDDLLAGRSYSLAVGFSMQENGMGYFLNEEAYQQLLPNLSEEIKLELDSYMEFWRTETSLAQLKKNTPQHILDMIPNDNFQGEPGVAFWLCRMSGTNFDFDKLVQHGINGLIELLQNKLSETEDKEACDLYSSMQKALQVLQNAILHYSAKAHAYYEKDGNPQHKELADVLAHIAVNKPQTFHQAVQLTYIYALVSGTYNYGRMDDYLGDFLADDLKNGVTTHEKARDILASLWRLINARKTFWDGRVIVGGRGRRNEESADIFASLAIEVAMLVRDVLPQLTLRFYEGQNPQLMQQALQAIGSGCIYPMLYNDDVNIPSIEKAFDVPYKEAVDYVPFGCGEYILNHRSVGTPSGVINLLKALEVTIFNGVDPMSGKKMGLALGSLSDFDTFEDLFYAYCKQVESFVEVLAEQEALEYKIAADQASYLLASILYDDCIERGKAIFGGGVRYLGGTLESYGNTNTADSLTAIKALVYDEQKIEKEALLKLLKDDFKNGDDMRKMLKSAPKYGNDDDVADEMLQQVHNHTCLSAKAQNQRVGLHSYLVVVINNAANTVLGNFTIASADGRKAYEPMANANNPSGGSDVNGATAFLNSLVKPNTQIHAGAVQNMKFSKEMFGKHLEKTNSLLKTYFKKGGAQAMITVLGREDLENALKEPEKYKNLIVRLGGFSARFVELDPKIQQEVLSRTMY